MKEKLKYTNIDDRQYSVEDVEIAGYYRIGDDKGALQIMLPTKPKWLHRKLCELLLGWEWIDIKDI